MPSYPDGLLNAIQTAVRATSAQLATYIRQSIDNKLSAWGRVISRIELA